MDLCAIGARIKAAREKAGMTQEDLAAALEISHTAPCRRLEVPEVHIETLLKAAVSFFREMNAIKRKFDVPFSGIYKGNAQFPGKRLIRLCQFHGFREQFFFRHPCAPFQRRWSNQKYLAAQGLKNPNKGFHTAAAFLRRMPLKQIIGSQHNRKEIRFAPRQQLRDMLILNGTDGNLSAITPLILYLPAGAMLQNVHPAALLRIAVIKKAPGVIAIGVGVAIAQHSHCITSHKREFHKLSPQDFLHRLSLGQLVHQFVQVPNFLHQRVFDVFYQNVTVSGAAVKEEKVAVVFRKKSTWVLPSFSSYIFRRLG